jgi:microcystin-dependent protein
VSTPFVGEIRVVAGTFAPDGWMLCNGQLLAISDNEVLFTLIGTTYGGDGLTTFALPDLRSRVPVHQGPGFTIGQQGGEETVTLTAAQLPVHTHPAQAGSSATAARPAGAVWAGAAMAQFSDLGADAQLSPSAVQPVGGSQPHDNMLPFLTVNFIISLIGIYPSPA